MMRIHVLIIPTNFHGRVARAARAARNQTIVANSFFMTKLKRTRNRACERLRPLLLISLILLMAEVALHLVSIDRLSQLVMNINLFHTFVSQPASEPFVFDAFAPWFALASSARSKITRNRKNRVSFVCRFLVAIGHHAFER